MFGILTEKEIEEVLIHQLVGRIGCHADGLTYIVPVSYAYADGCIYVHGTEGMKMSIMRKNPKVCFQTDQMEDMANWKSVIAWGEFEELNHPEERNNGLKKLLRRNLPFVCSETVHLSPAWPFEQEDMESIPGIVYRVKLTEKTGRFETSGNLAFFAS